ncbi:MAG TPA: CCA tRNA nucleotidyltransferase [Alphaproteobacteria bacterium]|nr:CCA tRNA nucleotidyltransferase [Alphaproteobacteria bacterium]
MSDARLPMTGWIMDPDVNRVMRALLADAGVAARYVGGAVRDTVRGAVRYGVSVDVDIATTAIPGKVIELLNAAGIKAVPTGIDHGTVTAVSNHRPVEITTLRHDVSTDGRRAEVAYTTDWAADAARRDFTMNAIYADADGALYDPLGGVADAKAGLVRFVGDPDARIQEDYLRILRFFRFFAWCGKGEMDRDGLQACTRHIDGLAKLSPERVAKELLKLISAENPMPAIRQMAACGVLNAVLPEAVNLERLNALAEIDAMTFFDPDPMVRLAAILPDDGAVAHKVAMRLRLSNAQRERLVAMLSAKLPVFCYMSVREMRRTAYRLSPSVMRDVAMLRWAGDVKRNYNAVQWRALLPMIESWKPPKLPLDGHHVRLAGVADGPKIGEVLREVEEWWIDTDFTTDEYSLIERMKAIVQATVL